MDQRDELRQAAEALDAWERIECDCDGAPDGGGPCLLHRCRSGPGTDAMARLRAALAEPEQRREPDGWTCENGVACCWTGHSDGTSESHRYPYAHCNNNPTIPVYLASQPPSTFCECEPHAEKWREFPCKLTVCDTCGSVIGWDESKSPLSTDEREKARVLIEFARRVTCHSDGRCGCHLQVDAKYHATALESAMKEGT